MAEEREDITHGESKESTSSEDNEDYEDMRVVAVIESNDTITRKSNETFDVTKVVKTCGSENIKSGQSVKTELIILDEAPSATAQTSDSTTDDTTRFTKYRNNPRVIELSDDKSKMELRREFKVDVQNPELFVGDCAETRKNSVKKDDNVEEEDGNADDILSRLPPGTILIKQSAKCSAIATGITRICSREDSDYVHDSSKDSTGTNSSESSGTASYNATGKVRRMQYRSVRSKKVVEVRRNPVRNKKKKPIDEDFTRPRQRLLALKRKPSYAVENPTRKRARTAPTPYMNTRSVTRKMYTVGATYQAPTLNDALEWKEWPSHGMHERPIWHPGIGLAYEYNERSFVSLDGRMYREIIEEPIIEVVSVDPHHPERMSMSYGRRNYERMRYYNTPRSLDLIDKRESIVQGNSSFQACMHGSYHSVLAYCSRIVTPSYKRNVDMKIRAFSRTDEIPDNRKTTAGPSNLGKLSQELPKMRIPSLVLPAAGGGPTMLNKLPETSNYPSTSATNELPKCLVIPRKTIHFTNVRNIQGNILQEVFNRSSKNTLIFLKPTDPPGKTAEKIAAALKSTTPKNNPSKQGNKDFPNTSTSQLNLTKLDDSAISDEALMEMSSIYNNLLPNEDNDSAGTKSFKPGSYAATRPITALVATRIPIKSSIDGSLENPNCKTPRASASSSFRSMNPALSIGQENNNPMRYAYANQATEIAKILAEYNEKVGKNSGMRNTGCAASNVLNVRAPLGHAKSLKMLNQCGNVSAGRTAFLSVVEQPKSTRCLKREHDLPETKNFRGSFSVSGQACDGNRGKVSATITSGFDDRGRNDDNQAMDLTTGKPRETDDGRMKIEGKTEESRKWLQELIEDTAILYCAAATSNQGDAAEYMNTLNSVQSIQWMGS